MLARKDVRFLLLTFGGAWLMAGVFWLTHLPLRTPQGLVLGILTMAMPTLAAWVVQRGAGHRLRDLGLTWRLSPWLVVAWLFGPVFALLATGTALLLPGVSYSPGMEGMFTRFADLISPEQAAQMQGAIATMPVHPFWLVLVQALIAGATVNAVAGLGEELGWRGLLAETWGERGFWTSSWEIGAVWGIWHAPMILMGHNYPHHPVAGVGMMVLFCLLLSPLFMQLRAASGTVLAPALAHGSLNASGTLALMLLAGGDDLWVGLPGIAGLLALLGLNLLLALGRRLSSLPDFPGGGTSRTTG